MKLEKDTLNIGYIPLLDCVAILWAAKQGYFEQQGLTVNLIQEASWSSLRDRLSYGFLDAAHCLSAMLPASALPQMQNSHAICLQTPLVLSVNQAFISLRQDICMQLGIQPGESELITADKLVNALKQNIDIDLAYVYQHSIHHYCLKEWLALADLDIALKTHLLTSPPPFMVSGIASHVFDGFCVGEPWNLQAELEGHSFIVASSRNIIPAVADKVLAVTSEWASEHPNCVIACTKAIQKAQQELEQLQDLSVVWQMLRDYNIIQFDCSPTQHVYAYHKISEILRRLVQHNALPEYSDFKWMLEQMQKWDGIQLSETEIENIAYGCIYQYAKEGLTS